MFTQRVEQKLPIIDYYWRQRNVNYSLEIEVYIALYTQGSQNFGGCGKQIVEECMTWTCL